MCANCATTTISKKVSLLILFFIIGTLSQGEPLEVQSNREWSMIDLVGREIVVERAKTRLEEHIQEVESQQQLLSSLAAGSAPNTSGGNANRTAAGPRNTSDIGAGGGFVNLSSTSASAAAARPPASQAQPQSLTPAATALAASSRTGVQQSPGARAAGGRGPSTGALPPSSFKPTHSETIELLIYQHVFLKYYERFLDVWWLFNRVEHSILLPVYCCIIFYFIVHTTVRYIYGRL